MKWTPVEEQPPKYGVRVLTLASGREFAITILHLVQADCWIKDSGFQAPMGRVTHWMPLPLEAEEET